MRNGKRLPETLTDKEQKALLSQFNNRYRTAYRNKTMIALSLCTGMRISELINLNWEDIEPETGRLVVKEGKGKKDRVLFIGPGMVGKLFKLAEKMDMQREGHVFTTLEGKPVRDAYLRKMIAEKGRKAGIKKDVHFHMLRHTYLTELYRRTHDIRVVQEVAGHADISTTQIYTHISGENVREAMLNV